MLKGRFKTPTDRSLYRMILTIRDPRVFDELVRGRKRYEGRRWDESYGELRQNDLILFVLEGSRELLISRVFEIKRFPTIREMVGELWKDLIPFAESVDDALRVYEQFYSPEDPAVAIGVEPVKYLILDSYRLRKWLGVSVKPLRIAFYVRDRVLSTPESGEPTVYECNIDGCRLLGTYRGKVDVAVVSREVSVDARVVYPLGKVAFDEALRMVQRKFLELYLRSFCRWR